MKAAYPGPLVRVMIALDEPVAGVNSKVCVLQEPKAAPGLAAISALASRSAQSCVRPRSARVPLNRQRPVAG